VKPQLYIIAGPNGAGKTTFAGKFLPLFTNCREFVNADEIAQRLSPGKPGRAALSAAREMLGRIRELSVQRVNFALETTLSGKSYEGLLQNLKRRGYEIHLYFLWLPDVALAIARVADRVRKGGHDIPPDDIRRRYQAGIANLFSIYRSLCDSWTLFDSSRPLLYTIAAETGDGLVVLDEKVFATFMKMGREFGGQSMREQPEIPEWTKAVFAMRQAMFEVVEEHERTGHPLQTWKDGRLYLMPPTEARRELELAQKNDPWAAKLLMLGPKG